jgi:hydroxymethylglutaryl-CoA reductase
MEEEPSKSKQVSGFSKLSKRGKLGWIVNNFFKDPELVMKELVSYWHHDEDEQKIIDGMSENTISNFILPYSVAPNFVINQREYAVPLVIEESSVVAAASNAAKFWSERGGFHARVISRIKEGSVYFLFKGNFQVLENNKQALLGEIKSGCKDITRRMDERGGGILDLAFEDLSNEEPDSYKLTLYFDTCDSMGANFINSVLESSSKILERWIYSPEISESATTYYETIMCILSNYTPRCVAEAWVTCPISALGKINGMLPDEFADRFYKAVRIAQIDPSRATTHNKGIFNGIDALVLATGNDFRAIEAAGHTYAARSGKYSSLSECTIDNDIFTFRIELPLSIGTVGGLTKLHPIARRSLELLGHPSADELMMILASTGLAQNFAAVRSLVTTGIQKGHMRMHLQNIAWQLNATTEEFAAIQAHFADKTISYADVVNFLDNLRSNNGVIAQ